MFTYTHKRVKHEIGDSFKRVTLETIDSYLEKYKKEAFSKAAGLIRAKRLKNLLKQKDISSIGVIALIAAVFKTSSEDFVKELVAGFNKERKVNFDKKSYDGYFFLLLNNTISHDIDRMHELDLKNHPGKADELNEFAKERSVEAQEWLDAGIKFMRDYLDSDLRYVDKEKAEKLIIKANKTKNAQPLYTHSDAFKDMVAKYDDELRERATAEKGFFAL